MVWKAHGLEVDLVIGKSFLKSKKHICQQYGAKLVGEDLICQGCQPSEVIERILYNAPEEYFFTDQFQNVGNLEAHQKETGPELVEQLTKLGIKNERGLVLVKSAGTGASFTGVASVLRESFPNLICYLVFPEGCDLYADKYVDHGLDGIAVGRRPPFLEFALIDEVQPVTDRQAEIGQGLMARDIWFYPGKSSEANYFASKKVADIFPDRPVVTFAYDSGRAYACDVS